MKKTMVLFQIFVYAFILGGCASNKVATQIDCRELIKEDLVQKEIQSGLANRFPNHKEAFISNTGLILQGEGVRYYPAVVTTNKNRIYSIIYNYSPQNESCKKIGYQLIQLDPLP